MKVKGDLSSMEIGEGHYKAYVGPPLEYDTIGAQQFSLLTSLGLRSSHKLLDIGCGSLRLGKLLIPYLNASCYYGIEPNQWLIDEGIVNELGKELIELKRVSFSNSHNFELGTFQVQFDFLIAQSIFSHASASQINSCFQNLNSVMLPNSIFVATFLISADNYEGENWVYPGCVGYNQRFIRQLAEQNDLEYRKLDWNHMNGQTWFAFYSSSSSSARERIDKLHSQHKLQGKFKRYLRSKRIFNNRITKGLRSIFN